MTLDIEDIKTISLKPGQTLVVQIDIGSRSPSVVKKMFANTAAVLREAFPDENIGILVMPETHALTVVDTSDTVCSDCGYGPGNPREVNDTPKATQHEHFYGHKVKQPDAYDIAMKAV